MHVQSERIEGENLPVLVGRTKPVVLREQQQVRKMMQALGCFLMPLTVKALDGGDDRGRRVTLNAGNTAH